MPPGTRSVMGLLTGAGHGAWFVGGCVRNGLIGAPVHDIDITTDARPDKVVALAQAAGIKAVPDRHRPWHRDAGGQRPPVRDHHPAPRPDHRWQARHRFAFTDRLEEDAARRDFTMNALYAKADGTVLDPNGEGLF